MVDNISSQNNGIQDNQLLNIDRQQSVEKTNLLAATDGTNPTSVSQLLDQAQISDAAKAAYEKEKELMRFSRLAQRVKEPLDLNKVSQIKSLLDSGRINEYLRGINTDDLAQSLLNSPSGTFLQS